MPSHPRGCVPPVDLARRVALSHARHGARLAALPRATQPAYDIRARLPAVKDQAQCGDCYVFAGVCCAESAAILAGRGSPQAPWSEQSVLDCGKNDGCDGGWPEEALAQARDSGLALQSDYPYQGHPSGRCAGVPHQQVIAECGYVGSESGVPPVQQLKDAMLAHGALAVAVAADDAFSDYQGGVFRGSGSTEINHAVTLAGWQDDATIPPGGWWWLRNSWGASWGERGYMRIAYNANQIGYGAMWARAAGAPVPPAPPVPPVPPGPVPPPPPAPVTWTVQLQHGHDLTVVASGTADASGSIRLSGTATLTGPFGRRVTEQVTGTATPGRARQARPCGCRDAA